MNPVYFLHFVTSFVITQSDFENIFTTSMLIMNIPVSFRRISVGSVISIFHHIYPQTRATRKSGIIISFLSLWLFRSGKRAQRLTQTFPIWYVVFAICTGIPRRISTLTERAEVIQVTICQRNDDMRAMRNIWNSSILVSYLILLTSSFHSFFGFSDISASDGSLGYFDWSVVMIASISSGDFPVACSLARVFSSVFSSHHIWNGAGV